MIIFGCGVYTQFFLFFLGSSEALKGMLCNRHLRQLLLDIHKSHDPQLSVQRAMNIPVFVEFADECLKLCGFHDNQKWRENHTHNTMRYRLNIYLHTRSRTVMNLRSSMYHDLIIDAMKLILITKQPVLYSIQCHIYKCLCVYGNCSHFSQEFNL